MKRLEGETMSIDDKAKDDKKQIAYRHKMNVGQCFADGLYAFFDKHHKINEPIFLKSVQVL